jgi:hypothetical protein
MDQPERFYFPASIAHVPRLVSCPQQSFLQYFIAAATKNFISRKDAKVFLRLNYFACLRKK